METLYVVRNHEALNQRQLYLRSAAAAAAALGLIALCSSSLIQGSERSSLMIAREGSAFAMGRQAASELGLDSDPVDDSTLGPNSQRAALGGKSGISHKKMQALKAMGKHVDPNKPAIDSHGNIIPPIPKVHIMRSASQILKDMMSGKKVFHRPTGLPFDRRRKPAHESESSDDPDSPGFEDPDSPGFDQHDSFKGQEQDLQSRAQMLKAKMRHLEQQEGDDYDQF